MPLWIVIGVAAAIFVLVIVLAATFNVFSAESAEETEAWEPLPHDFTPEDLDGVSFRPALRGYRMEDVDDVMRVLRNRIDELEAARGQQ